MIQSLFGNAISMNRTGDRIAVSEPLEHKYYIYDYNESTSSWSILQVSLDSEDNTSSRYIMSLSSITWRCFVYWGIR